MASVPDTTGQVLLQGVAWSTYEAILSDIDGSAARLTYDRGRLEIMSPSHEHEWIKKLIGRMVETMTEELGIPIHSGGSTTLKDQMKQRGLEPDECYYVQNEPKVRGRRTIDLQTDPPPDLAIEVDLTRSSLDRLSIYASLGVPELWRFEGGAVRVHQLQPDRTYVEAPRSGCFPFLPMSELSGFLERVHETDETTWVRTFRAWVKGLRQP